MKIKLFAFTACIVWAFTSVVYAQQAKSFLSVVSKTDPENDLDGHSFATSFPFDISTRAVRSFTQSFKQAKNVHWYKIADGLMAYFTENGIKTRAGYDHKGNWLYTMRSYNEIDLPKEIRAQVKSNYFDYTITRVNEITKAQQIIYLVQLLHNKSRMTIRVCEGEDMQIVEAFEEI